MVYPHLAEHRCARPCSSRLPGHGPGSSNKGEIDVQAYRPDIDRAAGYPGDAGGLCAPGDAGEDEPRGQDGAGHAERDALAGHGRAQAVGEGGPTRRHGRVGEGAAQVAAEGAGGRVPGGGLGRQRAEDHRLEVASEQVAPASSRSRSALSMRSRFWSTPITPSS